ncbi:MAG: ribosome recycling factor [Chitinophagales bacterium]|nr:ribosome recycling factor [Chitinophagales bacterium]
MSNVATILNQTREKMDKAIEHLELELSKVRAGKASPAILNGVTADAYGASTPINQLANVATPDGRTISIQPWDKSLLQAIEKAILQANIGITPQNDGEFIRLNIPPLTEERRRDLVKQTKTIAENTRVSIRHYRKEANDAIKDLQKDGLAEDESKKAEATIQNITNDYGEKVEKHLSRKEEEIMTV